MSKNRIDGVYKMGNMYTDITSNNFELIDDELAQALVRLHNMRLSDEESYLKLYKENDTYFFKMYGAVNWDKYINEENIFDLFSYLLKPESRMKIHEMAYMDGNLDYDNKKTFTHKSITFGDHELYQKLNSENLSDVLVAIQEIQGKIKNLDDLCNIFGIPFAFINSLHDDYVGCGQIEFYQKWFSITNAPYQNLIVLFLVHQCILLSDKKCKDIGMPSFNDQVLWSQRRHSIDWDLEDIFNQAIRIPSLWNSAPDRNVSVPDFMIDVLQNKNTLPSIWGIDLSGLNLTRVPKEILDIKIPDNGPPIEITLDLRNNSIANFSDEEFNHLCNFEGFHFDNNPIPEERLAELSAIIDSLW